ncbi:MAG TPA: nucleotidyltransferase domain-containing protein [Candidatus Bathyarchaeia archaeon]|nr:nucleotidyltransferase domain-containing protein [Candidatus Bathyarchaeia archaeon]
MSKNHIKNSIRKSIEKDPLKSDIKKISLFGSHLDGKPRKDSDVDLLIEFAPKANIGFFRLVEIQQAFEKILRKKVDLLTREQLSKYFRKDVLQKAQTIYEK